jgi:hypothetical protein
VELYVRVTKARGMRKEQCVGRTTETVHSTVALKRLTVAEVLKTTSAPHWPVSRVL